MCTYEHTHTDTRVHVHVYKRNEPQYELNFEHAGVIYTTIGESSSKFDEFLACAIAIQQRS